MFVQKSICGEGTAGGQRLTKHSMTISTVYMCERHGGLMMTVSRQQQQQQLASIRMMIDDDEKGGHYLYDFWG